MPVRQTSLVCALAMVAMLPLGASCRRVEAPGAPPASATVAPDAFVDRVWRVAESPTVAVGQLYVFLSDGTLVVTSPQSKPALGRWQRDAKGLEMTEDGISYRVDVLALSADEFRIHINDPGAGVDLRLVPAAP